MAHGVIVGSADLTDDGLQWETAVRWVDGVGQSLGGLGGQVSFARGINEHGTIVGTATMPIGSPSSPHAFIYRDGFDPDDQLTNLLDYGLGNGSAQNGDPSGTSSFSALCVEGQRYYWITSQWAFFSTLETAHNTIVGPGAIVELEPCLADINDDGVVDTADLGILIALFGLNRPQADFNGDNIVDTADLGILIAEFGSACQ